MKVKKLKVVEAKPDGDMIRMMREQLALAERGEVVACGMAIVTKSGEIVTCYGYGEGHYEALLGAASCLSVRLSMPE